MFINTIIKFKRDIHSAGAPDRKDVGNHP
jgi:hypothetical protein